MERKPPLKMTPFDLMISSDFLQTMKFMIPYLPTEFQRMAGIYAKMTELQNAIYYFQPPYYHSRSGRLRLQELENESSFIEDLKACLPSQVGEMLEQVTQIMGMMELFQDSNMEDLMAAFQTDFMTQTERTDSNERMDESSGDEEHRPDQAGTDQKCCEPDPGEDG